MRKSNRRKKVEVTNEVGSEIPLNKPAFLVKKEIKAAAPKTESFSISWDPLYSSRGVDDEVKSKLIDIYFTLQKNPEDAIETLQSLKSENSDVPMIYNMLYTAYLYLDEKDKAQPIIREAANKFSNLLFGKIAQAELNIMENKPETVLGLFNNSLDFRNAFPERNSFHIVEALSYYAVMAKYYITIKDYDKAKPYMEEIKDMDAKNKLYKLLDSYFNKTAKVGFFRRALNRFKRS